MERKTNKRVVSFLLIGKSGKFKIKDEPYQYKSGGLVVDIGTNELGLIESVKKVNHPIIDSELYCFWGNGGGITVVSNKDVRPITIYEVIDKFFLNNYAKSSLLERQVRMFAGEEYDGFIGYSQVREFVDEMLKEKDDTNE